MDCNFTVNPKCLKSVLEANQSTLLVFIIIVLHKIFVFYSFAHAGPPRLFGHTTLLSQANSTKTVACTPWKPKVEL